VSNDEDHPVADQLPCGGDRLLGITEVVRSNELYLLAEHATRGVEIAYGQRSAPLLLLAEPGFLARHRARHADQDLRPRGPAERDRKHDNWQGD